MTDLGLVPSPLEIECQREGDTIVLALRGELDLVTVPTLERELDNVESDGSGHTVIDLGGLEFMDSSGIASLLRAQRAAESRQRRFSLRPGPDRIQRVFELTRLIDHFTFQS
jgi:anti-sigma B factor antagonist